jgi:hypothetical protein
LEGTKGGMIGLGRVRKLYEINLGERREFGLASASRHPKALVIRVILAGGGSEFVNTDLKNQEQHFLKFNIYRIMVLPEPIHAYNNTLLCLHCCK